MIKASEIREMTEDEREQKLAELREDYFHLRFQDSIGQLTNKMKIRNIKKDIARILTVQNEVKRAKTVK